MTRPSWHEYFLEIAQVTAKRASCKRAKHGCVLVDPKTKMIVATGYNGAPSGMPHCLEADCLMVDGHCKRCRHAEENAIQQVLKVRQNLQGLIAYVTGTPCDLCATRLIQEGVAEVYYATLYGKSQAPGWFDQAGIKHGCLDPTFELNQRIKASHSLPVQVDHELDKLSDKLNQALEKLLSQSVPLGDQLPTLEN